ncbi:hypothetical protein WJ80_13460 [Burkholderia ubonensis]|nr:hypothetical protein WJ80_13460 [Burkholderia ubonensis]
MFSADVLQLFGDHTDANVDLLSVSDRWNLARFLGALSTFGLHGKPLKKASRQSENVEQIVVTTGASLVGNQSACFELLNRLRAPQTSAQNVPLLSEAFPQLLVMLRKQLNDAQRHWMLNLLDRYVASTFKNRSAVVWERKEATRLEDSDQHGRQAMRSRSIAKMLAQTGEAVPVRQTRTGRKKFMVSDADVQRLANIRRSLLAPTTAARYLGMSVKRIEALAKAGLIASNETRIDTRSLDRLLENIVSACVRDTTLEDPISLAEALRLYVPIEESASFFSRLADGDVRLAIAPDRIPTFRTMYAARGDVISASPMRTESNSLVSVVEAARRLGIKQEVMYHLVNIGLVRTRMGRLQYRAARVIDVDDLQNFTQQFLPLFTLAKTMGISAREAPSWARRHGIEIVTGPSVDGGRQYWIHWSSAAKVSCDVAHNIVKGSFPGIE